MTTKRIFLRGLFITVGLVVFGIFSAFLYTSFFPTPKEKMQARELEQFRLQYQMLNDRFDDMQAVLDDIQDRDDNIYRVIFESEPIPKEIRSAGYGGADRYDHLEGYKNADLMIQTTKKLDHIAGQLYVQSKSFDDVFELAKMKEEMMNHIPAIQPIEKGKGRLVSGFGSRFHPILKYRRMHPGIDISAPRGTPIYATADGTITHAGRRSTYGITVIIDHGYGYETLYGHMSKVAVKKKQKVKRGDLIGYVGSTGLSEAPHVHYEVRKDKKQINPVNYFYNDFTPEEYEKVLELASKDNQVLS